MKRAERLHALHEVLRHSGAGGVSSERLAREFEVSVRTVKRDLHALVSSGAPIWSRPGPGSGRSWTLSIPARESGRMNSPSVSGSIRLHLRPALFVQRWKRPWLSNVCAASAIRHAGAPRRPVISNLSCSHSRVAGGTWSHGAIYATGCGGSRSLGSSVPPSHHGNAAAMLSKKSGSRRRMQDRCMAARGERFGPFLRRAGCGPIMVDADFISPGCSRACQIA